MATKRAATQAQAVVDEHVGAEQKEQQIDFFSADGKLLLSAVADDSTKKRKLHSKENMGWWVFDQVETGFATLVDTFGVRVNLPSYPVTDKNNYRTYPDVDVAFDGAFSSTRKSARR